jgi:hypothetical protein
VRKRNDLVFEELLEANEMLMTGAAQGVQIVNTLEEI